MVPSIQFFSHLLSSFTSIFIILFSIPCRFLQQSLISIICSRCFHSFRSFFYTFPRSPLLFFFCTIFLSLPSLFLLGKPFLSSHFLRRFLNISLPIVFPLQFTLTLLISFPSTHRTIFQLSFVSPHSLPFLLFILALCSPCKIYSLTFSLVFSCYSAHIFPLSSSTDLRLASPLLSHLLSVILVPLLTPFL